MKPDIQHHPGCTAKYPEKPKGEPPQMVTTLKISRTETVHQCVDCGAFVIVVRGK